MKGCAIVLCVLSATAVLSHDHAFHHHRGLSQTPHGCGFQAPDTAVIEEMAIEQEERVARLQHQQERRSLPGRLFRCDPERDDTEDTDIPSGVNGTIKITTYVHAIQKVDGSGLLSDEMIKQNFEGANRLLSSSGFHLEIVYINRITSDAWYISEWNSVEQNYMHSQHKKGRLDTLNVYYKAAMMFEFRYCGYANLAEHAKIAGSGDGIVMDTNCATDETVLAHEVGKNNFNRNGAHMLYSILTSFPYVSRTLVEPFSHV